MRATRRRNGFFIGLLALCLAMATERAAAQAEPSEDRLLIPLETFDRQTRSVGTLATSEEICSVLGHPIFRRPGDAYRLLDSTNYILSWEGIEAAHLWVAKRFEASGIPRRRLALQPDALKKAEERLSACLQRKETDQPELYGTLKKHFLHYLTARCHTPAVQVRKSVDDRGHLTEVKIPGRKEPCIDFDYNSGDYGYWNSTTFALMLVWREAHPVLMSIFDRGDTALQTRMAAQARKDHQEQADAEERRRLAAERTQEAELRWQQYAAREKTLLEEVFNFATVGDLNGSRYQRWVEIQHCTVSDGQRQIDVRTLNMTAFRVFQDSVGGTRQLISSDGSMRLATSKQIPMDRLQNAWRLAFRSCPGTRSRF